MHAKYEQVIQALARRGLQTHFMRPWQLVVSRQTGPPWPDRGNSFWIARLGGNWYVGTWGPFYYRLDDERQLEPFCVAFADTGTRAQARVPDNLATRFGLVEIDDGDFDTLQGDASSET
jgi:hypothetical protein